MAKAASNVQAPCLDAVRSLLPELGRIITQLHAQTQWINIWLLSRRLLLVVLATTIIMILIVMRTGRAQHNSGGQVQSL